MKLILTIMAFFVLASVAQAHPGGQEAYGGHYDREKDEYHVHSGPLEGRKYQSQENMIKVLKNTKGGDKIIRQAEQGKAPKK
jgi:hypothetical protein